MLGSQGHRGLSQLGVDMLCGVTGVGCLTILAATAEVNLRFSLKSIPAESAACEVSCWGCSAFLDAAKQRLAVHFQHMRLIGGPTLDIVFDWLLHLFSDSRTGSIAARPPPGFTHQSWHNQARLQPCAHPDTTMTQQQQQRNQMQLRPRFGWAAPPPLARTSAPRSRCKPCWQQVPPWQAPWQRQLTLAWAASWAWPSPRRSHEALGLPCWSVLTDNAYRPVLLLMAADPTNYWLRPAAAVCCWALAAVVVVAVGWWFGGGGPVVWWSGSSVVVWWWCLKGGGASQGGFLRGCSRGVNTPNTRGNSPN